MPVNAELPARYSSTTTLRFGFGSACAVAPRTISTWSVNYPTVICPSIGTSSGLCIFGAEGDFQAWAIGDTACKYWVPEFGSFFVYVATIGLLLWKPAGLFGRV